VNAKHFGWTPHYEDVDDNPYLNDFYEDMQRWSEIFHNHYVNNLFRYQVKIW